MFICEQLTLTSIFDTQVHLLHKVTFQTQVH